MRVRLAYGRSGLEIEVPRERTTVIEPVQAPALAESRRRPDRGATRSGGRTAAAATGETRADGGDLGLRHHPGASPRREMIGAVLRELDGVVRPEDVAILIATGTHRANTEVGSCGRCWATGSSAPAA